MTDIDLDISRSQGESLETIPENDDSEKKTVMDMIIAELKESWIKLESWSSLSLAQIKDLGLHCTAYNAWLPCLVKHDHFPFVRIQTQKNIQLL